MLLIEFPEPGRGVPLQSVIVKGGGVNGGTGIRTKLRERGKVKEQSIEPENPTMARSRFLLV